MHPAISLFLARARITDLHGQARHDKRARIFRAHRWLY